MSLDAELEKVPIDNAAGTWLTGSSCPKTGMSMSPAPPPQMALIENAKKLIINNTIRTVVMLRVFDG